MRVKNTFVNELTLFVATFVLLHIEIATIQTTTYDTATIGCSVIRVNDGHVIPLILTNRY
jgi:hypothetical protein